MGFVLLIGAFVLYFLPTLVAHHRKHLSENSIFIVNLFFGWTILGWVICLAWSLNSNIRPVQTKGEAQVAPTKAPIVSPMQAVVGAVIIMTLLVVAQRARNSADEKQSNTIYVGGGKQLTQASSSSSALAQVPAEKLAETRKDFDNTLASAKISDSPISNWSYISDKDEMSDKLTRYAVLKSENPINLEFPYNGPQLAKLTLRKHPRHGTDVIFEVEKGQLDCDLYDCPATIKFDSGKPQRVNFAKAADNSTNVMFAKGGKDMAAKIKKAKKMLIEPTFYRNGNVLITFDTTGLVWD